MKYTFLLVFIIIYAFAILDSDHCVKNNAFIVEAFNVDMCIDSKFETITNKFENMEQKIYSKFTCMEDRPSVKLNDLHDRINAKFDTIQNQMKIETELRYAFFRWQLAETNLKICELKSEIIKLEEDVSEILKSNPYFSTTAISCMSSIIMIIFSIFIFVVFMRYIDKTFCHEEL